MKSVDRYQRALGAPTARNGGPETFRGTIVEGETIGSLMDKVQAQIGQPTDSSIAGTISQWRALQQSDGLGFAPYASFIMANPGWPGEDRMRRLAETAINPDSYAPALGRDGRVVYVGSYDGAMHAVGGFGAIFGTVAGIGAGLAVALTLRQGGGFAIPLFALILSVASQCGDLFESWVKRRFKVKDSSQLIPGHGGVMDRVDGLVFAAFAAFILAVALPPMTTGQASGELAARLLGN